MRKYTEIFNNITKEDQKELNKIFYDNLEDTIKSIAEFDGEVINKLTELLDKYHLKIIKQ